MRRKTETMETMEMMEMMEMVEGGRGGEGRSTPLSPCVSETCARSFRLPSFALQKATGNSSTTCRRHMDSQARRTRDETDHRSKRRSISRDPTKPEQVPRPDGGYSEPCRFATLPRPIYAKRSTVEAAARRDFDSRVTRARGRRFLQANGPRPTRQVSRLTGNKTQECRADTRRSSPILLEALLVLRPTTSPHNLEGTRDVLVRTNWRRHPLCPRAHVALQPRPNSQIGTLGEWG